MRVLLIGLLTAVGLAAQVGEPLVGWPHYKDVAGSQSPGLNDVVLDVEALDGSRQDHADLRLYDAGGREVPYALRILRDVDTSEAFEAREFNRVTLGNAAEASLDLGEAPEEHNQIEVRTKGQNFRRRTALWGSADGAEWALMSGNALLFRFSSGGRSVDEHTVSYPPSRFRYLRVRVQADPVTDSGAPAIESLTVRRRIQIQGEEQAFPTGFPIREATRDNGRPASTYRIDLMGRIPVQGLQLSLNEESFSRPYRLEKVDSDAQYPTQIASGRLARGEGQAGADLTLRFQEVFARELLLVVTDDRNPTLNIYGAAAISAARQVVFENAAGAQPSRLYYGNPSAGDPRYDFGSMLPRILPQPPSRGFLQPQQANPNYRPPEKPFTERAPWLVYLVLAAASLGLLVVLKGLVGEAERLAAAADDSQAESA